MARAYLKPQWPTLLNPFDYLSLNVVCRCKESELGTYLLTIWSSGANSRQVLKVVCRAAVTGTFTHGFVIRP